jgi:hypothetical protein
MSNKPKGKKWEPPPLDWRHYDDPYKDGWRTRKKKKNKHGKNTLRG